MNFTYDFAEIDGKVPMVEFLDSLTVNERAKIFAYIEKLIELINNGIPPKENLSKIEKAKNIRQLWRSGK